MLILHLSSFVDPGNISADLRLHAEGGAWVWAEDADSVNERQAASELLQRFKRAWESGDVEELMSLLSDRAKVIMKIEFLSLNGEYGRGQADYIVKEFFSKGKANGFTISRYRELSGGVSAYAAGTILYQEKKTGLDRELKIFISLEERGGKWSVEEFRINER
jgi:hypothetical protein